MKYPRDSRTRSIKDILKIKHQRVNITGRNPDVDTATAPEDLWPLGGRWVPPVTVNSHNITSTDASDVGALVIQGTADDGGNNILIDNSVDFVASGAQIGDVILNDSTGIYSVVNAVSVNILVFERTTNNPTFSPGDLYRVVSSSGGGASVICIDYLSLRYTQRRGFYILNGLTAVPTDDIFRINGTFICGADDRAIVNAGTISITDSLNTTVTDQILPSEGIGSTAVFTVPSGFSAYISSISASILETSNAGASVSMVFTRFSKSSKAGAQQVRLFDLSASGGNTATREFEPTLFIPQLTDIVIRCSTTSTNNVDISGNFSVFLVKND